MTNRVIDATLRFRDQFSGKLGAAAKKIEEQQAHLKQVGGKIERVGKGMTKTGKALTAGITAPIAAFAAKSLQTAADFESAMSKVASISGATGGDLEALTKKAQEMGAKTKFSASESAEAFSYMAMAGWKTTDMLDGIEGIMYLAGATGEDLATTSDIVTDALTAFGLSAKDTDHFVDVLAKTANSANTDVSMMGESFKYVAPAAGALGYSVDDVSVALGLMANSEIKASSAGTALRSLLTNLAKPTDAMQTAMEKLGISLTDASGEMKPFDTLMKDLRSSFSGLSKSQKAQYAATLAGKTGMSGLLAIVNASEDDFSALSGAIADCTGASKEMYDVANDNLQGQLTELKSTLESIMITVGNKLLPVVKPIIAKVKEWAEKLNNLDDKQVETIVKIAGIAAAIGPLLLGVGKVVTTIGKVYSSGKLIVLGLRKARIALLELQSAFNLFKFVGKTFGLLNPKTILFVAIAGGLVAAGIAIYKNWDKIKPLFEKIGEALKKFGEWCKTTFTKIKDWFSSTWQKIRTGLSEAHRKLSESTGVIGAVYQNIKNKLDAVKQVFSGVIQFVKGVFTGNWRSAWQGVVNVFKGIWSGIKAAAAAPLNGVIGLVNTTIRAINKLSGGKISMKEIPLLDTGSSSGTKQTATATTVTKFNEGNMYAFAKGTRYFAGGTAMINEKGGELVNLPRGTAIWPHDRTVAKAYQTGAADAANRLAGKIVELADAKRRTQTTVRQNAAAPKAQPTAGARTYNIHIAKLADTVHVRDESDVTKLADTVAERIAKELEETEKNIA